LPDGRHSMRSYCSDTATLMIGYLSARLDCGNHDAKLSDPYPSPWPVAGRGFHYLLPLAVYYRRRLSEALARFLSTVLLLYGSRHQ
jgi:hypothetical protein